MPIKGITDRGLSFPEIGRIRKGSPKTANGQMGKDLDYFRVVFDESEKESEAIFRKVYGDQPRAINCVLWESDLERICSSWLECHVAGRMIARSDGEVYLFRANHKTGEVMVRDGIDVKTGQIARYDPKQPEYTYTNRANELVRVFCRPITRMRVLVPELGRGAYLLLTSSSLYDAINLAENLKAINDITGGHPEKKPLVLMRKPREISCPNADGTRARRVKWLLSIELQPQFVQAMIATDRARAYAMAKGQTAVALLEGPDEPDEELEEPGDDHGQEEPQPEAQPQVEAAQAPMAGEVVTSSEGELLAEKIKTEIAKLSHLQVNGRTPALVWACLENETMGRGAVVLQALTGGQVAAIDGAPKELVAGLFHWLKIGTAKDGTVGANNHAGAEAIDKLADLLAAE